MTEQEFIEKVRAEAENAELSVQARRRLVVFFSFAAFVLVGVVAVATFPGWFFQG